MQASEGKELIGNVYLSNRRRQEKKDTHRKKVYRISEWLRLTYGNQTARMGQKKGTATWVKINIAADKKEWK